MKQLRLFLISFFIISQLYSNPTDQTQKPTKEESRKDHFIQHFYKDTINYLVIRDTYPEVMKLFDYEPLKKMIASFPQESEESKPQDQISFLKDKLQFASMWYPDEIALGMKEGSATGFIKALKGLGLALMIMEANESFDPDILDQMPILRNSLLKEIESFQVPEFYIYAHFRSPIAPNSLFSMSKIGLSYVDEHFPVSIQKDEWSYNFEPKDLLDEKNNRKRLMNAFLDYGFVQNQDDPLIEKYIKALENLGIQVSLKTLEQGLLFKIQSSKASTQKKVAKGPPTGKLYQKDPQDLAYIHWDLKQFRSSIKNLSLFSQTWKKNPLGQAINKKYNNYLNTLIAMTKQFELTGSNGEMRFWYNQGLEFEGREQEAPNAIPLKELNFTQFWDSSSPFQYLTSVSSLAHLLSGQLLEFEDQMSRSFFRNGFRGNTVDNENTKNSEALIYEHFNSVIKMVHEESFKVFKPGIGLFVESGGKIDNLVYRPKGDAKYTTLKDLAIPKMAMIGSVSNSQQAEDFLKKFSNELLQGLNKLSEIKSQPKGPLLNSFKLSPKITAKAWSLEWLEALFKQQGQDIEIKGDLKPHFFTLNNCLILSSSIELSKELIQLSSIKKNTTEFSDRLVTHFEMNSTLLKGIAEDCFQFIDQIQGLPGEEQETSDFNSEEAKAIVNQALDIFHRASMKTNQTGDLREYQGYFKFH